MFGVLSVQSEDDKETWWSNEKVRGVRMEESQQKYKEMHCKAKREVEKAK